MNLDPHDLRMCFEISKSKDRSFKEIVNEYKQCIQDYLDIGNKVKIDTQHTPQKEQPKSEFSEVTGVYYGREIVKEGSKDGRQWIMYKYKIKIDAVDKPLNFTTFNNCKGSHDIKEGDEVKVVYKEEIKTNANNQEYKAKTAIQYIPTFSGDDLE